MVILSWSGSDPTEHIELAHALRVARILRILRVGEGMGLRETAVTLDLPVRRVVAHSDGGGMQTVGEVRTAVLRTSLCFALHRCCAW